MISIQKILVMRMRCGMHVVSLQNVTFESLGKIVVFHAMKKDLEKLSSKLMLKNSENSKT